MRSLGEVWGVGSISGVLFLGCGSDYLGIIGNFVLL